MKVPKIQDDNREIASIWTSDEGGYIVGKSQGYGIGCTQIVVYGELGPHCYLPWLAVYADETLIARVPAYQCQTIIYAAAKEG